MDFAFSVYPFFFVFHFVCFCLSLRISFPSNVFVVSLMVAKKYMVIISVLLLVETGIAADVLLNSEWEKVYETFSLYLCCGREAGLVLGEVFKVSFVES